MNNNFNDSKGPKEYNEKEFTRHTPSIFRPITSTVFALIFIGLLIYLNINNKIETKIMIMVSALLLIFIGASWGNNYILKKNNQKKCDGFEEEASILIKYMKEHSKRELLDVTNKSDITFTFEKDDMNQNTTNYNYETREFEPNILPGVMIEIGVNCCGLVVDKNNHMVKGVNGLSPNSIWLNKNLNIDLLNEAIDGRVFVDFKNLKVSNNTSLKYLKQTDTFIDKKKGYLCIGEHRLNKAYDIIKINPDVFVVLYNNELVALYIKIDSQTNV